MRDTHREEISLVRHDREGKSGAGMERHRSGQIEKLRKAVGSGKRETDAQVRPVKGR